MSILPAHILRFPSVGKNSDTDLHALLNLIKEGFPRARSAGALVPHQRQKRYSNLSTPNASFRR